MTANIPLKEQCLREAMDVIRDQGLEGLSLRAVARRLGVSHQAPYKHFTSKDALLAEVIRRCLQDFAAALEASAPRDAPAFEAMNALGAGYLRYAAAHPLEYNLMFTTRWPDAAQELGLGAQSRAGFDILVHHLGRVMGDVPADVLERDAMFVWSTIHGLASLLQSEAMGYLSFSPAQQEAAVDHSLSLIKAALLTRLPAGGAV